MSDGTEKTTEELRGTVDNVSVYKEDTGFTVLELESDGCLYTVVGVMPQVYEGERLVVTGTWQFHASYGEQFRVKTCERYLPATASAIMRYLSSGAVKGIGPVTATKIVEVFGDSTLDVLENAPERLAQIKGISKNKALEMSQSFAQQAGMRQAMLKLATMGLQPTESIAAWKKWGVSTLDIIAAVPYLLCSPDIGVDFARADAMAINNGCETDDEYRVLAGVLHILNHNTGNGHTCLPYSDLCDTAARLLSLEPEIIGRRIEEAVEDRELESDEFGGRRYIFLPELYAAETYCASRLTYLAKYPPAPIRGYEMQVSLCEALSGVTYNEEQHLAIKAALELGGLVLTGGPGTGKTTTLNAIIDTLETAGETVSIAAPTGRAAKRITEITGHEAKTIHRLLEVEWNEQDKPVFKRNENNRLDCDAIVVDEVSMMDVLLFEALLRALRDRCRIILVGDRDQLPSVGAGNVMSDIITSRCLPSVRLTEVFRQAQMSAIVRSAHHIVKGEMPELDVRDSDFFFIESDNDTSVAATIVDLCYRRLPAAYGFDPLREIQVLCPGKSGVCGVRDLNRMLQARFNPAHERRSEITINATVFREGDKVMQVKNNYDVEWSRDDGSDGTGVYNGDIGIIEEIDRINSMLRIRFDDRTAYYSLQSAEELEHAYAMTVHKSQGSEFEAVIVPVAPCAPRLCYRNLLYTAVTRAKKILILIGRRSVVAEMVAGVKKRGRFSALKHLIIAENGKPEKDDDDGDLFGEG